jgi:hypothetical protein
LRLIVIELLALSPNTVRTPEPNVAVVAAFAVALVPAITPAASTMLARTRRTARRQSLLRIAFIVSPLRAAGRRFLFVAGLIPKTPLRRRNSREDLPVRAGISPPLQASNDVETWLS